MADMHVVALVPRQDHVSTRYRVSAFAEKLADQGLQLRVEPLKRPLLERIKQLTTPRQNEVVLLQRKLLPVWQLLLLRSSCRALAYDFDDAVFAHDSLHRGSSYSLTRSMRFRATVKMSDVIFAGNQYLADTARRYTRPDKVTVIPTCVNPTGYLPAQHHANGSVRLVWIGTSSTLAGLESARETFNRIGQAVPNVKLRVVCNRFPEFDHLPVEKEMWSPQTESSALRTSDIGVSWVEDDLWGRGKCGLKVLQYMAAGLPVVANPVGVHREMVSPDEGFLAASSDEWVQAIQTLAEDVRLRQTMGQRARQRLEQTFQVDRWAPVLAGRLQQAAQLL